MTNSSNTNYPKTFPSPNLNPNENWYLDLGAKHHMTPNLTNVQNHSPYSSCEQIIVGNGNSIPITNIGSTFLSSQVSNHFVKLSFVLHAPHLSHNPISIAPLCYDNHAYIEFFLDSFL